MNKYEVFFHGRLWAEVTTALSEEIFRDQMLRLFPIGATFKRLAAD